MENTKNKEIEPTFLKIIYFDESAAQDYLDITNGGRLDWSKEDNRKRAAEILTEIEAQAKGGFNILNFIKDRTGKCICCISERTVCDRTGNRGK